MYPCAAILLAAGKSTRMRSKLPKPLHPVCGLPMTAHIVRACRAAGIERIVVVIGHEAERVRAGLGEEVEFALQEVPRGTGDAARAAEPLLKDWPGTIVILAGDMPLLPAETLRELLRHHHDSGAPATLLTAFLDDPTGYGRVIRGEDNRVRRIVEEKDATPEERAVKEWFPSIYAFQGNALWQTLRQVQPNNAQGEYYLTDTIRLLVDDGVPVEAIPVADARYVLGVNTRVELSVVTTLMREHIQRKLMLSGVTLIDPATTYVEADVEIGQDTVLQPNTYLLRGTRIGEDCEIGPNTHIERSTLGNSVRVRFSQVVESILEDGVRVGPFANLRRGTHLHRDVKIGDFVETKNAIFEEKAQASHLSYIGDAEVGAGTNIGAGTITCNYDGYTKSLTRIGRRVFVGSHSTLVAPLTIGEGAFIAAGSAVTEDVPADALAIGRSRMTLKEGWAKAFHERQQKLRAEATQGAQQRPPESKDAPSS